MSEVHDDLNDLVLSLHAGMLLDTEIPELGAFIDAIDQLFTLINQHLTGDDANISEFRYEPTVTAARVVAYGMAMRGLGVMLSHFPKELAADTATPELLGFIATQHAQIREAL